VLEGNIGYLRISSFYPWSDARPKLRAAFELLADTDGLILDLRQNGGGESEGPKQIVAALLGPKAAKLQDIERRGRRSADPPPEPELPPVAADRPVAVLVDRRSASASEYVAYSLQAAGRAKVIGSRSGGLAHLLGDARPVGAGYALFVPEARPVNLATGGNWEGQGVAPDLTGGDDPLFRARVWMSGTKGRTP
jgi:C-terminal processing protease CtpA/Prc